MGNNSRSPEDYELAAKYRQQQWLHDQPDQGRKISRNRRTKQAVEVIRLHEIPSIDNMDIYTFRMMENDLIKVHHLVIDSKADLCAVNQIAHLLVQYIPIRLNNIRNFDREEALTILSAAFRAFHLLEIKFGKIQPQEELIGFNEQGKTKVWLNRNSAVNKVDKRVSNETAGQSPMSERVRQLFEMIEQRTRYVLLPPIIKEEIYHPFTTYLSALKVIEKFAYYQKLNLRKYLQLGHQRSTIIATVRHERRPSNFTEYKPSQQICCDRGQSSFCESAVKQPPEFRRIYSVNSIHNPSNNSNFHYPAVQPIIRGERQFLIKHSIMSNSSQHESIRPSSVYFTHSNVPSQSVEHVRSSYLREGPIICKTLQTTLENVPKAEVDEHDEDMENQHEKEESISSSKGQEKSGEMRKESVELEQPSLQQHQFSIIDKMNEFIAEQAKKEEKATDLQKETPVIQPNSPTFIRVIQPKCEILSFAPSQNNLPQTQKTEDQQEEQRRLSIENKDHKLEFAPDFQIAPGSILNYCTAVQSKLHMATHREHSIIDIKKEEVSTPKREDEKIEQYIREKYGVKQVETKPSIHHRLKVQRVASKYASLPKPPKIEIPKHSIEHHPQTQDFLDVNFLEKSLDKRYNAEHQQKLEEKRRKMEENDTLNIAKLEEGLQKFSMSQLSQKNTEQQIISKESIPKKQQSSYEIRLGPQQTSFQSYYPFKEKTINEKSPVYSPIDTDYLRKTEKRSSKYLQSKKPSDYYHAYEDNKHEYSFQGTNKSLYPDSNMPVNKSYYIKQQSDYNSIQAKSKKRLEEHSEQLLAKTSSPTRRISYNQLRQFLWN